MIEPLQTALDNLILSDTSYETRRIARDECYKLSGGQVTPTNCGGSGWFQPFNLGIVTPLIQGAVKFYTEKTGKAPSTFLDVGCGLGHILYLAEKENLITAGIEMNPKLIKYARMLTPNSIIFPEDIFKFQNYDKFDIIWLFNPANGGELDAILPQIQHPCLIIKLNSRVGYLLKDFPNWSNCQLNCGVDSYYEAVIANF